MKAALTNSQDVLVFYRSVTLCTDFHVRHYVRNYEGNMPTLWSKCSEHKQLRWAVIVSGSESGSNITIIRLLWCVITTSSISRVEPPPPQVVPPPLELIRGFEGIAPARSLTADRSSAVRAAAARLQLTDSGSLKAAKSINFSTNRKPPAPFSANV